MSMIHDIYYGEHCPADETVFQNEGYKRAYEEITRTEQAFLTLHPEITKNDLIDIHDSYTSLLCFYSELSFERGVRFCAQFLINALQSE